MRIIAICNYCVICHIEPEDIRACCNTNNKLSGSTNRISVEKHIFIMPLMGLSLLLPFMEYDSIPISDFYVIVLFLNWQMFSIYTLLNWGILWRVLEALKLLTTEMNHAQRQLKEFIWHVDFSYRYVVKYLL